MLLFLLCCSDGLFFMEKKFDEEYFSYLKENQDALWKKLLCVRLPYILFLKFFSLGRSVEVGCGVGRNLKHLHRDSVGVDVIPECVQLCNERGLCAVLPEDLKEPLGSFDSLLFSHVIEHFPFDAAVGLLKEYMSFLKKGGKLLIIVPQLKGYASDDTHMEYYDESKLRLLCEGAGFVTDRSGSYPFPKIVGNYFKYNETYCLAYKP